MLDKITGWATGIHTIVWARLQMFIGAVWAVLSVTDITPLLNAAGLGKYVPFALFAMGLITELVRRYKAEDL